MKRFRGQALLALLLMPCGVEHLAGQTSAPAPAADHDDGSWRRQVEAWRSQREHELAAPDSWLTLIGLEWLKPGVNSFGAAQDNLIKIHAKAPDHIGLLTVSDQPFSSYRPMGDFLPTLSSTGGRRGRDPLARTITSLPP